MGGTACSKSWTSGGRLTGNQKRIVTAAILGDMLEFFDYFLIGFVLAFVVGPWKLTFLQSAIVLLSSGIGAIFGAYFWGWMADKIGRRPVFNLTILNFSLATGALVFHPRRRLDLPGPVARRRGLRRRRPVLRRPAAGAGVHARQQTRLHRRPGDRLHPHRRDDRQPAGGYLSPEIGWRGLFAVGVLPGLAVLVVRAWVPESPRWLLRQGRVADAKKSLAWALEIDPGDAARPDAGGSAIDPDAASWTCSSIRAA